MLRQTPGVRVRELSLQGVAVMVQIRGMNGGHAGDIGFYLDGIPLTDSGHADTYSDTTILIPLEVESLEVIKGPVSVLYGRGNGAGTAAYQGIKTGNFTKLLIRGGSYNFFDASGIIARDHGKFHQVYAFQGFHTDNSWRENSEWDRTNLSARWTYDITDDFVVSLNLRAAIAKWNSSNASASWLPIEKAVDDGSGLGSGQSHRDRYDARLWANWFVTPESQLTYYFFATKLENNMGELDYPAGLGPGNQHVGDDAGGDQTGRRNAYGNGLVYNYKSSILGDHDFSLTLGGDYLYEKQKRDEYTYLWGYGTTPQEHIVDMEFQLKTLSFYGEVMYEAIDNLTLRLGARYDKIGGDVTTGPFQKDNPNMSFKGTDLTFFSPKIGVSYNPLYFLELYANYGKGFNMPGLGDMSYFTDHQLKGTVREQYEFGFRLTPFNGLEIGSAYYLAGTTNDVQTNPDTKKLENAGETKKQGLETYARYSPIDNLTLYADFTYQDAKYKVNPANRLLEGRRMTRVPRYVFNAEVSYQPPEGFGGRISYNWNGNMVRVDNPAAFYPLVYEHDYGSMDIQMNYRFTKSFKLSLDVLNVMNERPVQGFSSNSSGYFTYTPVAPTTVYLTLDLNFD
jgi:iron complex outermembrane receptor protein